MGSEDSMPLEDRLRLEFSSFLYAAAAGFGFALYKEKIGLLALLLWVSPLLMMAVDWLFIRGVYAREKYYGKLDFAIDCVIVFALTQMMRTGLSNAGLAAPLDFEWWWWLAWVYGGYICWDYGQIRRARSQQRAPEYLSLIADLFVCGIALIYFFLPTTYLLKQGRGPFWVWFIVAVIVSVGWWIQWREQAHDQQSKLAEGSV